jgi:hypothetical protein
MSFLEKIEGQIRAFESINQQQEWSSLTKTRPRLLSDI